MVRARLIIVVLALMGLALLATACGSDQNDANPTEAPVSTEQDGSADAPAEAGDDGSVMQVAADPLIQIESETFIGDVKFDPSCMTLT